ncbi:MAG: hypothetical protein CO093_06995 [Alphaproteobacteria bacterium CG_4_9_14_3_um_filter_47_13]|nr:MAG: hypothetical protein CO093_06995 [Alphaproteobacteria bacterium CG_4_9_14_3_um_filter_47_13]
MLETTLRKGDEILLDIQSSARRRVVCGLRWDPLDESQIQVQTQDLEKGKIVSKECDLDLLCLVFDKHGRFLSGITGEEGYRTGDRGNIYHTGDVVDGEDYRDDEQISLELFNISANIHQIFFIAEVQSAHTFGIVPNPEIRIANAIDDRNFAHAYLGGHLGAHKNSCVFGSIYRTQGGTWTFKYIGEYFDAAQILDWPETLVPFLEVKKGEDGKPAPAPPLPKKGETVPLFYTKQAQHRIVCGLNWDPGTAETYDLDLSCIMYNKAGEAVDGVSAQPEENIDSSGKIYHSGDDTRGEGDRTDDEAISVELKDLPANICHIVFIAEIQSGHNFEHITNPSMRIADGKTNEDQLLTPLSTPDSQGKNGCVFARISRKEDGWTLTLIEDYFNGEDIDDIVEYMSKYIL